MGKSSTSFKPGEGGRIKGVPNKLTANVKETVLKVFQERQQNPKKSLNAFADKYPRDFYNIAARLIPTEISGTFSKIKVEIVRRKNDTADPGRPAQGTETGDLPSQEV